ncbi:MAG: hypothetical protein GVY17_10030 [Cyanobacteria bacterium]|jgi:beta-lactamase class A|nr:hypothetical protein [Cyanobacteria bacterium GSL.Bin21]
MVYRPQRKRKKSNYGLPIIGVALLVILTSFGTGFWFYFQYRKKANYKQKVLSSCEALEKELQSNQTLNINVKDQGKLMLGNSLRGVVNKSKTEKYRFTPKEDRKLDYQTSNPVKICVYNKQNRLVQENKLYALQEYSIFVIPTQNAEQGYEVQFNPKLIQKEPELTRDEIASTENFSEDTEKQNSIPEYQDSNPPSQSTSIISQPVLGQDIYYNVKSPPNLAESDRLQRIVDNLITLCIASDFSTRDLSITLIDINNKTIAQYQGNQLQYPASIAKLFWLVVLYGYDQKGIINLDSELANEVDKMMAKSDNESASYIIDQITQAASGAMRSDKQFNAWYKRRIQLNKFFKVAGYSNLNITQKTFPIPYLEEYGKRPKGLDLQMRHLGNRDKSNPIRNKLKTWHAARLMYEIVNNQAISPRYSQKIQDHLERNLHPQAWKNIDPRFEFNPVQAFFGESLPTNIRFLSKAGWTSSTRQEVAYIETPDQETKYILAIFAEDKSYAKNWNIFPKLSKYVFQEMTKQDK